MAGLRNIRSSAIKSLPRILPIVLLLGLFLAGCGMKDVAPVSSDSASKTRSSMETPMPEADSEAVASSPSPSPSLTSPPVPSPSSPLGSASTPSSLVPTPAPGRQPRGRQDIRAVYLTSWTAGNNLDAFLQMVETTSLNAVVIDIREGDGRVAYPTEVPAFRDNKGFRRDYDPKEVLAQLHEKDIWVIGRIVCFKDAFLPRVYPELAIRKKNGDPLILKEPNGSAGYWMNPANPASWEPLAALTAEAVALGFDEIQYDYIRFPETTLFSYTLPQGEETARSVHIEGFLEHARNTVPDAVISIDIFGVPCLFTEDIGDLGQVLETIGTHVDIISPMVYPSHYCRYETGILYGNIQTLFDNHPLTFKGEKVRKPDQAPYEIVYNSLRIARDRLDAAGMEHVTLRPYLQAFTMTAIRADSRLTYDAKAYQAQMQATQDAGGEGWIFWNAGNRYAEDAFR